MSGGEPGTSHYLSSLPPHEPRSPRSTQGQPHPLQGNDKGLVPGLLGHRPPARLAHNAIVHLQHGQHLTCKARVGAQGRPGVGGGEPLRSPAPGAPYSLASSPPPRCCLALLRSQPWEGLPASAAAGERPGTAVSSCSQPRRRTCSVPVGERVRGHHQMPSSKGSLGPQECCLLMEVANPEPARLTPWQPPATLGADQLVLPSCHPSTCGKKQGHRGRGVRLRPQSSRCPGLRA